MMGHADASKRGRANSAARWGSCPPDPPLSKSQQLPPVSPIAEALFLADGFGASQPVCTRGPRKAAIRIYRAVGIISPGTDRSAPPRRKEKGAARTPPLYPTFSSRGAERERHKPCRNRGAGDIHVEIVLPLQERVGGGTLDRSGGGNGTTLGAVVVAKFDSTGGFLAPSFTSSGSGTSTLQLDRSRVNSALRLGGIPVLSVSEF